MRTIIIIPFLFLLIISGYGQNERSLVRKGNREYNKARNDSNKVDTLAYNKAEIAYRKAIEKNLNSFEGGFNLGNALYKQKKFSESTAQYTVLALREKEKEKLASTWFNLGNSLLNEGKLEEAIDAYKNSLKAKPDDRDAKYNLSYAQHLKKKQQQSQCQNPNQDDKKDQQKKDEQQQQQQKGDQQKKDEQQQQQKGGQQKKNISKEDAKRLLESIQNDEKNTQDKVKKERIKAKRIKTDKEW
jgi:Ca-activated chloride channel family protein